MLAALRRLIVAAGAPCPRLDAAYR